MAAHRSNRFQLCIQRCTEYYARKFKKVIDILHVCNSKMQHWRPDNYREHYYHTQHSPEILYTRKKREQKNEMRSKKKRTGKLQATTVQCAHKHHCSFMALQYIAPIMRFETDAAHAFIISCHISLSIAQFMLK